ncbi:hypothetical protein SNE40_022997 [Patella caerulea]|uniref:Uncharacterized protein n=1 Tax=Patella caerulea TaxID=87958 RepID=A0AAN8FXG9_PATCE
MDSNEDGEDSTNIQTFKRRLCLKMSDMDSKRQPWRSMLLLGSTVLLSFLGFICRNQSTRSLRGLSDSSLKLYHLIWFQIVVALVEAVCVAVCIRFRHSQTGRSHREAMGLFSVSQTGYVMVVGYLTLVKEQEQHLMLTYFEPLIAAAVVFGTTGKPMTLITLGALIVSSFGASITTLPFPSLLNINHTVFLTTLWGICVSARNVCCKHIYQEQFSVELCHKYVITSLFLVGTAVPVCVGFFINVQWVLPMTYIVFACAISVTVTYIISCFLLKNMSVTSVALVNIWVKTLYDFVLVTSEHRSNTMTSLLGITILILAQLLYTKQRLETADTTLSFKPVPTEEFYTRMLFLLFAACVGSLFFYALTPKLSERDLQVLSYVGLDRAVRSLLQEHPPTN